MAQVSCVVLLISAGTLLNQIRTMAKFALNLLVGKSSPLDDGRGFEIDPAFCRVVSPHFQRKYVDIGAVSYLYAQPQHPTHGPRLEDDAPETTLDVIGYKLY